MTRKILYVDDDLESGAMVGDYLRNLGYDILTVERAADALSKAAKVPLDTIILDVNLIGRNGPELMELLRQQHPGVPVVLYTGMNSDDKKVTAMLARGAWQYLSKNAPLEALVGAVVNALK